MKQVEDYEAIRRAYFIEHMSIRAIHREMGYDRGTIRKAITQSAPQPYQLTQPRPAPVLGPYKAKMDQLLEESDHQPRKQRYTAHRIYELLQEQGYEGSEGAVHNYVWQQRKKRKGKKDAYLPLEFDPGMDAQVDWTEAAVILAGEQITVQVFLMRLNYSKARFAMAFPFQKQEAFFEGHNQAFQFFDGYVCDDQLRDVFWNSNLVVMTNSLITGSSAAIRLAAIHSRGIIAPRILDVQKMVEEKWGIITYSPGSVENLADTLINALSNPILQNRLSKANYSKVIKSSSSFINDHAEVFYDLSRKDKSFAKNA